MNTKYLLFILLVLSITSCRQEETDVTEVSETTPPIEIEGAFFSGQIKNSEGFGVETTISVYQSELLVGEIQTDAEGHYTTVDLDLEVGPQVTFAIEEQDFLNQYKRNETTDLIYEDFDIQLLEPSEGFGLESRILENPGSNDLVRVFGTLNDKDGNPIVDAFNLIVYDPVEELGSITFQGGYGVTDENGFMDVLVPKGENLFYFSALDARVSNEECQNFFNEIDTTFMFFLGMDNLGVVTEDLEVIERDNISLEKTSYQITGSLFACQSLGGAVGQRVVIEVRFPVNGVTNLREFDTQNISSSGEFSFDFDLCYYGPLDVIVNTYDTDGFAFESEFSVPVGGMNLPTIVSCASPSAISSFMNLNIGSDNQFENIELRNDDFMTGDDFASLGFHPELGSISMIIQAIEMGENPITLLDLNFTGESTPYGFSAQNLELTYDVSDISPNRIIGQISGEVITNNLGVQTITGELSINL